MTPKILGILSHYRDNADTEAERERWDDAMRLIKIELTEQGREDRCVEAERCATAEHYKTWERHRMEREVVRMLGGRL